MPIRPAGNAAFLDVALMRRASDGTMRLRNEWSNAMPIPAAWSNRLLAVLRIVAGLGLFHHGTSKLFGLPPFPMPLNPLLYVAGTLELVGGALIVIGLFVRPAAFILSGMCAAGYFLVHAPQGFFPSANGGEAIMLYSFILLYLAAAGGGAWSLDAGKD